jgi:hypothetical protein
MAINISHPTNTIDGQDVLNLKSGNSSNIELTPDSGTVNVNGDINITGNFRVQGTTTTINSTTTSIVDPIIVLGTDDDGNPVNANDGKDRGVSFFYNDGATKTGFFGFDASNNDFRFIPNATITSEIVTGLNGTITINLLNAESVDTTILDAGDLNITTNVISSSVSGNVIIDSGADTIELIGNTNVTGNLDVSGNITLGGNITIGDQSVDTVNVVADFTSNLIPQADLTYNLGSTSKKWNNLYVGTVTGNVTGQVSDISNHTTTDLTEGTRLYYTTARTRADVNAGTGLTYTAATGEFKITDTGVTIGTYGDSSTIPIITINAQGQITTVTTTSVAGVNDFDYDITNGNLTISTADGGSYVATVTLDPFTTTDLAEGTNQYYTSQRVRDELSAGTGVHYDDTTGIISIGQAVETTSDVDFNNVDTVTLDAGNLNITTNVISSDVSGDIVIDSGADSIELIGDTNVTGNLSVSADAVIYGNLTVQGTTTSINTTDTEITDNILVLNQGEAGAGVSKGTSGIEIARGSLFSATWKWNEATDRWEAKEGTSLTAIAVSEINAGNVNIANNTIVPTDTNGDLNLNSNGTGQVLINGRQVATDTDALMYAIVFGG